MKETCPICGDYLPSQTKTITEELSDHFVLDTGSVVCKECFDMEAPPEECEDYTFKKHWEQLDYE